MTRLTPRCICLFDLAFWWIVHHSLFPFVTDVGSSLWSFCCCECANSDWYPDKRTMKMTWRLFVFWWKNRISIPLDSGPLLGASLFLLKCIDAIDFNGKWAVWGKASWLLYSSKPLKRFPSINDVVPGLKATRCFDCWRMQSNLWRKLQVGCTSSRAGGFYLWSRVLLPMAKEKNLFFCAHFNWQ